MISVLCSTYGRTHLLCEMVECFLRQTLQESELMILNDCPGQTLVFDHPRVRIINCPERFPVYGDKRNHLLTLARYPLVCLWDDDDIYLPDFLAGMLRLLPRFLGGRAAKPALSWTDYGGHYLTLCPPGFLNAILVERSLLLEVGGFARVQYNEDVPLTHALVNGLHLCGPGKEPQTCPQYIFRQASGRLHMTQTPDQTSTAAISAEVAAHMAAGTEPVGTITLVPHWKNDYQARALRSWERHGDFYANGHQPNDNAPRTMGSELQRVGS